MASAGTWLRASIALLTLAGCGELKKPGPPASSVAVWRTAMVETVKRVQVENGEGRGTRAAVGLLSAGIVGALVVGGATEENLGTSSAWEYSLRDGEEHVTRRSFAVAAPGDCVRYAGNIGGDDVPLERIPPESCTTR